MPAPFEPSLSLARLLCVSGSPETLASPLQIDRRQAGMFCDSAQDPGAELLVLVKRKDEVRPIRRETVCGVIPIDV